MTLQTLNDQRSAGVLPPETITELADILIRWQSGTTLSRQSMLAVCREAWKLSDTEVLAVQAKLDARA